MVDGVLPAGEIAEIAVLTVGIGIAATVVGALIGLPLGAALGMRPSRLRVWLRPLLYTFYALPPIVAGLLAYLLLSHQGPLGPLDFLFTPAAIVVGETLLTTPLIAGLAVEALRDVPQPVRETVEASGPAPALHAWTLLLEARHGVAAGVMVAFGRSLAEVAAALLVGGNIRHETRTLATAIFTHVQQGQFGAALVVAAVLLGLALSVFIVIARLERAREVARW